MRPPALVNQITRVSGESFLGVLVDNTPLYEKMAYWEENICYMNCFPIIGIEIHVR